MFVSDLLKNARPEEDAPSVQSKGSSIYDRIREEQRRIENEWFIVENKKKELEALRSTAHAPCKRHELRAQTEIKRKCEELQSDIAEIESGSRLRDFNLKASSYIHEYQKQQFCTLADDTPPARLGGPCEQSNAVMDEFAVNVEGGCRSLTYSATTCAPSAKRPCNSTKPSRSSSAPSAGDARISSMRPHHCFLTAMTTITVHSRTKELITSASG